MINTKKKLFVFDRNIWNKLTVRKKRTLAGLKNFTS